MIDVREWLIQRLLEGIRRDWPDVPSARSASAKAVENCADELTPTIAKLVEALERILEESECGCACDDENCCVRVGEYCDGCIAHTALAELEKP